MDWNELLALNENQLKHIYEPAEGLFICESIKVIRRALDAGYEVLSFLVEESRMDLFMDSFEDIFNQDTNHTNIFCKKDNNDISHIRNAKREICANKYSAKNNANTPSSPPEIITLPRSEMENITGFALTGGVLAAMRRKPAPDVESILNNARRIVILDDIENPTNIGSIFRNAAGIGYDAVVLTKGCCDPLYRRSARVSMGTVFQIPWCFVGDDLPTILKRNDFTVIGMALTDRAVNIDELKISADKKAAIILGNEDHGISESLLTGCDAVAKIPMAGCVDSLNVAAASAIALWAFH